MRRFANRRLAFAAKDPRFQQIRHRLIQSVNVAHSPAKHNNVRVEDVNHVRQLLRQPRLIAAQRQFRHRIPLADALHNLAAFQRMPAQPTVIGRKAGAGDKGFNAALLAAVARHFSAIA